MGLERAVFKELIKAKETFRRDVTLTSLGYPDLLVEKADLAKAGVKDFPEVSDPGIAKWHNWEKPLYETTAILTQLGITPTYYDINVSRGCEEVIDLNTCDPLPRRDIILDGGTTEHLMNLGHAWKILTDSVGIGGFIIHLNPTTQFNHGMFNLNATTYYDFYGQNGFEIRCLKVLSGSVATRKVDDVDPVKRVQLPAECSIMAVVRKVSTVEFRWPVQSKYLRNKALKA